MGRASVIYSESSRRVRAWPAPPSCPACRRTCTCRASAASQCVRFHPNSNYVLTGSSDCSLRLWDVSTGSCVRLLCGHTAAVTTVAVSEDGQFAASGSADKTVRLWDLSSGKQVCAYAAHAGSVWSVAFSHDEPGSGLLASGGADSAVRLWVRRSRAQACAQCVFAEACLRRVRLRAPHFVNAYSFSLRMVRSPTLRRTSTRRHPPRPTVRTAGRRDVSQSSSRGARQ